MDRDELAIAVVERDAGIDLALPDDVIDAARGFCRREPGPAQATILLRVGECSIAADLAAVVRKGGPAGLGRLRGLGWAGGTRRQKDKRID
jgi:hypothetical protein